MAKKTRKQKQRAATRRPAPSQPQVRRAAEPAQPEPVTGRPLGDDLDEVSEPVAAAIATAGGATAAGAAAAEGSGGRRRVERVSGAAAQSRQPRQGRSPSSAAAMLAPLDSDEAAIPFDRVPYVPSDLRRVGIIAACMIALIVVAAIIVSNVVH